MSDQTPGERHQAHNFMVTDVEPADAGERIGVTLTDVRGGRVTLHMEREHAEELFDILSTQLSAADA
ncbi:MAG TPA: hypothetical protein VGN97_03810 [Mesorhizobium sp.]|jgi:hypothetical protein|nr:hypothetical protein [Mesorhizobium sp.]